MRVLWLRGKSLLVMTDNIFSKWLCYLGLVQIFLLLIQSFQINITTHISICLYGCFGRMHIAKPVIFLFRSLYNENHKKMRELKLVSMYIWLPCNNMIMYHKNRQNIWFCTHHTCTHIILMFHGSTNVRTEVTQLFLNGYLCKTSVAIYI